MSILTYVHTYVHKHVSSYLCKHVCTCDKGCNFFLTGCQGTDRVCTSTIWLKIVLRNYISTTALLCFHVCLVVLVFLLKSFTKMRKTMYYKFYLISILFCVLPSLQISLEEFVTLTRSQKAALDQVKIFVILMYIHVSNCK